MATPSVGPAAGNLALPRGQCRNLQGDLLNRAADAFTEIAALPLYLFVLASDSCQTGAHFRVQCSTAGKPEFGWATPPAMCWPATFGVQQRPAEPAQRQRRSLPPHTQRQEHSRRSGLSREASRGSRYRRHPTLRRENLPGSPATFSLCAIYSRTIPRGIAGRWKRADTRCANCTIPGRAIIRPSSGWPTSTICSNSPCSLFMFEKHLSSSSIFSERFWASSKMRTVWRPQASLLPKERFKLSKPLNVRDTAAIILAKRRQYPVQQLAAISMRVRDQPNCEFLRR